ncbi:hypothetical protein [Methanobrevibacter millerae]|uniref:Uncharacterized protein n=1 Tax=Methanobrevibacter millerae TaxID=230361 RepID=A0A1G5WIB3_9EURY|nr:hypothetical protein [Methanobrevibacter millerae]SDA57921.1 hypothetical protein SAMN02910315_01449 [Methanobrevibacter millerae]
MDNCPNCNNRVCVNSSMTHLANLCDLIFDSSQPELMMLDEYYINMGFLLNDEYPEKLRKPRKIPTKLPQRLPELVTPFIYFEEFPAISITCKKTPWIFHYADSEIDVEFLDN